MVTVIKNWYLVYLFGNADGTLPEQRWGRVIWGEVVIDASGDFEPGHVVCSAPLIKSNDEMAETRTGKVFSLFGPGQEIELSVEYLDKLRLGVSPAKFPPRGGS